MQICKKKNYILYSFFLSLIIIKSIYNTENLWFFFLNLNKHSEVTPNLNIKKPFYNYKNFSKGQGIYLWGK